MNFLSKRFILVQIGLLSLFALGIILYLHFFSAKVAYINVPKLMHDYSAMEVVKGKIEKKASEYRANLDSLRSDFDKMVQKHEREKGKMSSREMELSVELLNTKSADMNRYQQAVEKKLEEQERELREPELKAINDYITEYSQKKGYDYVLAANDAGVLIYAKEKLEITEEILKELNAKYKNNSK